MISLYWIINLSSLSIPLLCSFHPKIALYKEWKALFTAILLAAIPYIIWDSYFTREAYWGFNEAYLSGHSFWGLPVEELAFFFCIPYACVFTHEALKNSIKPFQLSKQLSHFMGCALILITTGIALLFPEQAYTHYTMFSCAIVLCFTLFTKPAILSTYFLSFIVMLVPFFVVNGILTGSWIPMEVVWYNDDAFSTIRIGTIPIEDISYAFSLLLLNLTLFELMREKLDIKK